MGEEEYGLSSPGSLKHPRCRDVSFVFTDRKGDGGEEVFDNP